MFSRTLIIIVVREEKSSFSQKYASDRSSHKFQYYEWLYENKMMINSERKTIYTKPICLLFTGLYQVQYIMLAASNWWHVSLLIDIVTRTTRSYGPHIKYGHCNIGWLFAGLRVRIIRLKCYRRAYKSNGAFKVHQEERIY